LTDRIFVTGAAGFLGSHAVRLLARTGRTVIGFDALTYAGDATRLRDVGEASFRLKRGDVADRRAVRRALRAARPDAVVHFAAESHATRGELDADSFYRTNVDGTRVVLEESERAGAARFVHISTDEVYGPILEGSFREEDKKPRAGLATSAYARSKGLADDLVSRFTGSMSVVVARPTNCFGPWQHPEKAFARWVTSGLVGETMPVWGGGRQVRQWLYVEDLAAAIMLLVDEPEPEPVYNVGPRHDPEIHNGDLALWVLAFLGLPADRILMTRYDRPDHDVRYSVDPDRIESLGWQTSDVWESFARTADWYRRHPGWWFSHRREAESIYRDRSA
jgi:dTDP-glucose 4,6-dehydratase